ncbi:cobalamin-5'-phosphate synthase [Nitrosomonas sp. PY1]|uniref:adenosylcobinamide-GDP ribazoletransferase n=1 Tax=Nitrosomonas sp. PY1 TaxID=1803906 RepID=UPI001FC7E91A|nr:adenosylcobinamide-GDP ribazoletransferase [Nitrosomonas sp. PY1]GKS69908.1 cobalamin-5'-phosphate synthase [Nitrosomonas sp. PY1]
MHKPVLIALQFLTRIPVALKDQPTEQEIGCSLAYYPLIGVLIGMILISLGWLLGGFSMPWISAAILLTVWVLLTGGLHLDGLSDSADAWVGGMGDHDKTLAIMKDPNCGPMGVIAIVLVMLLKITALHVLIQVDGWVTLLASIILARTMLVLLFLTTRYVRNIGLGACLSAYHPRRKCIAAVIVVLLCTIGFIQNGYVLVLAVLAMFLLLRYMMLERIGGTTGDTAGALVEFSEVIVLLAGAFLQ